MCRFWLVYCSFHCCTQYTKDNWQAGGGLDLVYRNVINVTYKGDDNTETMECSEYLLKTAQLLINLNVIYHMSSTSVLTFCNDLANLIELNITEDRG